MENAKFFMKILKFDYKRPKKYFLKILFNSPLYGKRQILNENVKFDFQRSKSLSHQVGRVRFTAVPR